MRLKNSSTMGIWENRNKLGNPKIEKKKIREKHLHTQKERMIQRK